MFKTIRPLTVFTDFLTDNLRLYLASEYMAFLFSIYSSFLLIIRAKSRAHFTVHIQYTMLKILYSVYTYYIICVKFILSLLPRKCGKHEY
jgi:hypothetical protein